jgi:hypothetical protein
MKRPDTSAIRARLADPTVTTREIAGALIHCMEWIEHPVRCVRVTACDDCPFQDDPHPYPCFCGHPAGDNKALRSGCFSQPPLECPLRAGPWTFELEGVCATCHGLGEIHTQSMSDPGDCETHECPGCKAEGE